MTEQEYKERCAKGREKVMKGEITIQQYMDGKKKLKAQLNQKTDNQEVTPELIHHYFG